MTNKDKNLQSDISLEGNGIVYNVSVKLEKSIAHAWLQWILEDHAPRIIASGCFTKFKVFELLDPVDEDGLTYIVQYFAKNREGYHRYITEFAEGFRKEAADRWANSLIAFRTVMKIVH